MPIAIAQAAMELYQWASSQNFEGHDPHDILSSPMLKRVQSPIARLVLLQLGRRSAINLHTLLRVQHAENPKALALFLQGLIREKDAITPEWERNAKDIGRRLLRLMDKNGGWGYLFPWQSRTHFLPSGIPNIVTTSFVGTALAELFRIGPSEEILSAIKKSANYVLSTRSKNGDAFYYAQNDPQIVFNASLLGAEFLVNAKEILKDGSLNDTIRTSTKFVLDHQRPDGGWNYGLEKSQTWEDSFHTGFVICSLKRIGEALNDNSIISSAERGFHYYKETYLEPDYAIKYFPQKRFPIDAHALGQAMVTFTTFNDSTSARHIANWTIDHLRSPKGYFYYQRHRLFTNRIPYIRWSNAWIFRGFCEILSKEAENE